MAARHVERRHMPATLVCREPRRTGHLMLGVGSLVALDDVPRTGSLLAGTLRHWVSERLGFGVFGGHQLVGGGSSSERDRLEPAHVFAGLTLGLSGYLRLPRGCRDPAEEGSVCTTGARLAR